MGDMKRNMTFGLEIGWLALWDLVKSNRFELEKSRGMGNRRRVSG